MAIGDDDLALGATVAAANTADPVAREPVSQLAMTMRPSSLPRPAPAGDPTTTAEVPRYEPVRLLGRGGIGEVTLARDNDIDRPVAVKRLRPDLISRAGVDRFVDEIRMVGQLEHPNIAPIHDVGIDDDGHHYFVMRYIEGETLETIIGKLAAGDPEYHRAYSFEYRTQIFLAVMNAIHYAHGKGIIHRDIKPANIIIGRYGEVVVMDWGIARKRGVTDTPVRPVDDAGSHSADPLFQTRHGSLIGTPAYMSPEQAAGETEAIDERSDIYSLCVLFYELLALRHYLADKRTLPDMLAGVITAKPEHPSHLHNKFQRPVPAELGWLIQRGLEKDPAHRFQSIGEMLDAVQRAVSGRYDINCYVTMMKRGGTGVVRFVDAHPRLAMLGFLGLTATALLGLIVLVGYLVG